MGLTLAHLTDAELVPMMAAGDVYAFEELYERLQANVYRFALRMSGSASVAEDVSQDVFLALMRDAHQYDASRGSVSTYLYGMTRNRVLRRLERDRAFVEMPEEANEAIYSDERLIDRHDPLANLTRNEVIVSVRQAILALPPHYREVVILCNLHEMNYEEAANVIGCAVGTVRSRLHRARELLMKRLQTIADVEPVPNKLIPARCVL